MSIISHSLAVSQSPDREHVLLEDKEIEHGRASLLRVTFLDPEAAVALGSEMVRIGRMMKSRAGATMDGLNFARHADPYPEAAQ